MFYAERIRPKVVTLSFSSGVYCCIVQGFFCFVLIDYEYKALDVIE